MVDAPSKASAMHNSFNKIPKFSVVLWMTLNRPCTVVSELVFIRANIFLWTWKSITYLTEMQHLSFYVTSCVLSIIIPHLLPIVISEINRCPKLWAIKFAIIVNVEEFRNDTNDSRPLSHLLVFSFEINEKLSRFCFNISLCFAVYLIISRQLPWLRSLFISACNASSRWALSGNTCLPSNFIVSIMIVTTIIRSVTCLFLRSQHSVDSVCVCVRVCVCVHQRCSSCKFDLDYKTKKYKT